jgi:AAA15 family ATPase/GTPase
LSIPAILKQFFNGIDISRYKFEVDKRSDGFKQFVSIILNLSIENETGVLNNKVILLDEPETHLHPSGQKYLRNEFKIKL